jgi:hypothetical protein
MDGTLIKSITKDKNAEEYMFSNLEKYTFDSDGTISGTHKYKVEEVLTPTPAYIVDGKTKEAYTITYSVTEVDSKDSPAIIDITNTFNNAKGIISVKPYNNSLTVRTNQDIYTEIILTKMDSDYVDNKVVYKDTYSDVYYNLEINKLPETISHMIAGKYEISTTSPIFTIESVELSDNEYVSLVEENGKWYVIIEETDNDSYGLVTINLTKDDHIGYESGPYITDFSNYKYNNYWKTIISSIK